MKKLLSSLAPCTLPLIFLLLLAPQYAYAQESHYHRALRSQDQNYGLVVDPIVSGTGIYWSRVRYAEDKTIIPDESREDSIARNNEFRRLCQLAYEAFEDGDYYMTAIYGDSALAKQCFTPELFYYMAVSLEKLECYKDADIAYKRAVKAGYMKAVDPYGKFQKRMEELKALDKVRKKEAKRKGEKFVPLSEGKAVPEPVEIKREPRLQLITNSLRMEGLKDGVMTAGSKCTLHFQLTNNGNAHTGECLIVLGEKDGNEALNIGGDLKIQVKKRQIVTIDIPIEADETLQDGELDFILLIDEPNGYGLPPRHIRVKARSGK